MTCLEAPWSMESLLLEVVSVAQGANGQAAASAHFFRPCLMTPIISRDPWMKLQRAKRRADRRLVLKQVTKRSCCLGA